RAAFAAVRGRHACHRLTRADEGAANVRREHAIDPRRVDALHAGLRLENTRVVDERVQRTELGVDGLEEPRDVALARDIGLHGDRAAAAGANAGDDRIGRLAIPPIVHAHGAAAFGQEPGGRRADAPAAACYDRDAWKHSHSRTRRITR